MDNLLMLVQQNLLLVCHQLLISHILSMQKLWVLWIRIGWALRHRTRSHWIPHSRGVEVQTIVPLIGVVEAAGFEEVLAIGSWRVVHGQWSHVRVRSVSLSVSCSRGHHVLNCDRNFRVLCLVCVLLWRLVDIDRWVQERMASLRTASMINLRSRRIVAKSRVEGRRSDWIDVASPHRHLHHILQNWLLYLQLVSACWVVIHINGSLS